MSTRLIIHNASHSNIDAEYHNILAHEERPYLWMSKKTNSEECEPQNVFPIENLTDDIKLKINHFARKDQREVRREHLLSASGNEQIQRFESASRTIPSGHEISCMEELTNIHACIMIENQRQEVFKKLFNAIKYFSKNKQDEVFVELLKHNDINKSCFILRINHIDDFLIFCKHFPYIDDQYKCHFISFIQNIPRHTRAKAHEALRKHFEYMDNIFRRYLTFHVQFLPLHKRAQAYADILLRRLKILANKRP